MVPNKNAQVPNGKIKGESGYIKILKVCFNGVAFLMKLTVSICTPFNEVV